MILITLLQMRSLLNDTKMYLQKKNVDNLRTLVTAGWKHATSFEYKLYSVSVLKKKKLKIKNLQTYSMQTYTVSSNWIMLISSPKQSKK